MKKLKCAVVGGGYLGKYHAEKYAALPECDLVAVVDIDESVAKTVAEKFGAKGLGDYKQILGKVDAVSIVVPTTLHHKVSLDFLEAGTHVLVEKPITVTLDEAEDLIQAAKKHDRVLAVGHLERFNAALLSLDLKDKPVFIESHRLSPFNPRANDVSVVLDLMIHDIDIILEIVGSELDRIDASGAPVLTQDTDIANARLVFKNGCVANVTASRISMKSERKMRLFKKNAYISVDFQNQVLVKAEKGEKEIFPGVPEFTTEESVFESGDSLLEEIKHFVECIREGRKPLVSGEDGKRALATAMEITDLLRNGK